MEVGKIDDGVIIHSIIWQSIAYSKTLEKKQKMNNELINEQEVGRP